MKRSEYERIKRSTIMKSPATLRMERQAAKRKKEQEMKVAFERKQEMIRAEEERKKNLPPSLLDQIKMKKDQKIRDRALHLLSEQEDDVKAMNQMMQYAQTVAVRDAQVKEAEELKKIRALEERELDLKMELERLEKIKMYNDRERKKIFKERKDAVVLQEQIRRREVARGRVLEVKMKEQRKIKARAQELEDDEERQKELKRIEAKKILADVLKANEQALIIKDQRRTAELAQDAEIQKYLAKKAQREQEEEERKAKIAAEKEREVARLRAMQKKRADKAAALDEIRARRAAEAKEREARNREIREAETRRKRLDELMEFNRLQALAKKQVLNHAEDMDRTEFTRNHDFMKKEMERVKNEKHGKHERRKRNAKKIRNQISEREKLRKYKKNEFLRAGDLAQRSNMAHINNLNSIKQKKIDELQRLGVPQKYISELNHHDPQKALLTDYKRGGKW